MSKPSFSMQLRPKSFAFIRTGKRVYKLEVDQTHTLIVVDMTDFLATQKKQGGPNEQNRRSS